MRLWPFGRRLGRHRLGAAVTGLPSGPLSAPEPSGPSESSGPPVAVVADVPVAPASAPSTPLPVVVAPRVELGFADGTSTQLDPSSEQARALSRLAAELVDRH